MKNSSRLLLAAATLVAASAAHAAIQTATDWFNIQGSPALNETNLAAPVVGTGGADSANNVAIAGAFSGFTLVNAGDSVALTGTVEILGGATSNTGQFRFALSDVNGSPNNNGWLGYFTSAGSGTNATQLTERTASANIAITGGSVVGAPVAPGAGEDFNATAGNLYDFSLKYTREANGSLTIDWFVVRQGGGYDLVSSFNDTSVNTYTFNRVAFLLGGSMGADQANFSNVQITTVPEPSSYGLMGAGALASVAMVRRRKLSGKA